jgi:putative copper export protein
MTPAEIVSGAFRGVELAGLLGFVGVVVMRQLARQPPHLGWVRPSMLRTLELALLGGVATVALAPSWVGAARVAAELAALVMCLRWGPGAVPGGFAAVLLLAPAGHAAGAQPVVAAILVDELHVASAGIWAGGVLVLATLRPPDGWRSPQGQDLLTRFGRVAMVAFAFTALTGLLRATEELTGFSDLWQTVYGVVLVAKSVGVLAMLALAAVTWRRGMPLARSDALVALAVMAATGLLAAFPNPPAGA